MVVTTPKQCSVDYITESIVFQMLIGLEDLFQQKSSDSSRYLLYYVSSILSDVSLVLYRYIENSYCEDTNEDFIIYDVNSVKPIQE